MHSRLLHDIARERIRPVRTELRAGTTRWNVTDPLPDAGCLGIELGVAAGSFSARMVQSGRFRHFFGVDVYGDGHNVQEYKKALRTVGLMARYSLLRMTFDQALDLFPDGFFDFVYCDGYAHTGEEGGRTLIDWYPKLKSGGVMAGDDYDAESWPLVVWAVNHVVAELDVVLNVTDLVSDEPYNRYRSWHFTKPESGAPARIAPAADLAEVGDLEKARIAEKRRQRNKGQRASRDSPPSEN